MCPSIVPLKKVFQADICNLFVFKFQVPGSSTEARHWKLRSLGTSSDCCDLSKIIEWCCNDISQLLHHLWVHHIKPYELQFTLFKYSLTRLPSTEDKTSFAWTFPLVPRAWDSSRPVLLAKMEAKKASSSLTFLCPLSLWPLLHWAVVPHFS